MNIVIIGNSAAGLNALETFRKYDSDSKITVISKEKGKPYSRVLLPYFLRGKLQHDDMYIRDEKYFDNMNAEYIEKEVVKIDEVSKEVILDDNSKVSYDKLLIATGSSAAKPPIPGLEKEGVYHMWTKEDAENLEPFFKEGKKVLVLGSGFVSLQAAWAAITKGLEVKVIELADRIMPSVLDSKGAQMLMDKIIEFGVDLRLNAMTKKIEKLENGGHRVFVEGQEPFDVDFVIVGTGVRPNVGFLEGTEVKIDRGILVDKGMRTNVDGIYAVGDVAQGPTTFGEANVIHALWPTAMEMGKIAGANMSGKDFEYEGSLNMNVTQLFEITVASMGMFMDGASEEVFIDIDEKNNNYVKIVLKDCIPVGGTVVGSSELVKLLGVMRPSIRKKDSKFNPEEILKGFHKKVASSQFDYRY
jgi:NAD(P)H-nitrite reductase large subunit